MCDAMARPFDPRRELSVVVHEHGVARVGRRDAAGVWTERDEPQRSMSVWIDDEEVIAYGLVLSASDPLVALCECSCGLWECNLVEGWAARVRRFGPYVLWITPNARCYAFAAARYGEALGPGQEELPELDEADAWELGDPDDDVRYVLADGSVAGQGVPSPIADALEALRDWPAYGVGALRPVDPPAEAREVPALDGKGSPLWIDVAPRADGRSAAFAPALTRAPVWCVGAAVDRLVAALTGRGA